MAKKMRFITLAFGENSVLKKYVLRVSKFFLKKVVLLLFSFFMNYFIAKQQTLLLTLLQLQS
jgi:hypothetical protein